MLGGFKQGDLVESGSKNPFSGRPVSQVLARAPPLLAIVPTWPIHDERNNTLNKDRIQGWGQREESEASGISAGQILRKGVTSWSQGHCGPSWGALKAHPAPQVPGPGAWGLRAGVQPGAKGEVANGGEWGGGQAISTGSH